MEHAHHGWVAPLEDADNAPHAAAVGLGRFHLDQHLVALHGAVDLVRRNENIVLSRSLPSIGPHEAVAVAVQIEAAGGQIVARASRARSRLGNAPVLAVELDQRAAGGHARELLQQQTAMHSAAQRELAHQLLVAGFLAGGARNPREQFLVRHRSRVGHRRRSRRVDRGMKTLGAYDGCLFRSVWRGL